MKKLSTALVILIVLIAAWLGAAWYTGTRIQAQASDIIARMNVNLANNQRALGTQIKQISYERGLLSSHARYAVISGLLGNAPLSETDVTFSHGPFPLAAVQRGNLSPQQYQAHIEVLATAGAFKMMADALMGGKPPLVADIGCSYANHCTGVGSMPPINADLRPLVKNAKLAFGGARIRFDLDHQSDTDYKTSGEMQALPLLIGDQSFGSGQITFTGNAQSITEVFSWKTDRGASQLALTFTAARPLPLWGDPGITPENLPQLIKTASAKLELSKPMVVDLIAHALNLTKGIDLDAARRQMGAQFDAMLTNSPEVGKFAQIQGDMLVSDWQYADGKLTINGQENPEVLEQIKQGYLAQLQIQEQAAVNAAAHAPGGDAAASAPEPAASGQ